MTKALDKVAILSSINFFTRLSEESLHRLADQLDVIFIKAGETLFHVGEPGDALFIIISGRVRVHEGDMLLNYLRRGDLFGEMAALDEGQGS